MREGLLVANEALGRLREVDQVGSLMAWSWNLGQSYHRFMRLQ